MIHGAITAYRKGKEEFESTLVGIIGALAYCEGFIEGYFVGLWRRLRDWLKEL